MTNIKRHTPATVANIKRPARDKTLDPLLQEEHGIGKICVHKLGQSVFVCNIARLLETGHSATSKNL
eukprot:4837192-Amphidinium_carterae.1